MFDIQKELDKKGLTKEEYEKLLNECSRKVHSTIEKDWSEISLDYNLGYASDSCRKAQQLPILGGAFVKQYYEEKYSDILNKDNKDEYIDSLTLKIQEFKKEKQKLSDERVQYNRLLREEARKESYLDLVKSVICENVKPIQFNIKEKINDYNENDLLVTLSDIHTGINIENHFNIFNEEVLGSRFLKYINEIIDIQKRHKSEKCYIVIGEVVSGLIHSNLRLQNNMDLMEQFKCVAELISYFLMKLSEYFVEVNVYTTQGNHSRITPNKNESLNGENMDILIPFYLKAKLQEYDNINIFENDIMSEVAIFNIRGNKVYSAHGHKDSVANVVQNFTMMFGEKPDIVLLGHRHTNALTTVYDTKVIQTGCMSGTDEYALDIRKTNKAEQVVSVIDNQGLLCLYDIQLQN